MSLQNQLIQKIQQILQITPTKYGKHYCIYDSNYSGCCPFCKDKTGYKEERAMLQLQRQIRQQMQQIVIEDN